MVSARFQHNKHKCKLAFFCAVVQTLGCLNQHNALIVLPNPCWVSYCFWRRLSTFEGGFTMTRIFKIATLALCCAPFYVSPASAQATRTWVSGVGDDVNPCSRTAPCKTFAGAISKTAPGGIIDALDPGGFGAVTITKSITIEGTGTLASILASGVNGVIVNAGATDTVVLRNLAIDGAGTTLGTNGVRVLAAGRVVIEGSTIQDFSNDGVDFESSSANAQLVISDTTISNINNASGAAAAVFVQSAGATATLNRVRATQSNYGLFVRNGTASVIQSVVSANSVNNVRV